MAIDFEEKDGGRVLEVHVSGTLAKRDYMHLLPHVGRLIKQHGKIRVLLDMTAFQGWSPEALWEEMTFDIRQFSSIESIIMIGERKWQEGISLLCRPLKTAKIRYFDPCHAGLARQLAEAA